MTRLATDQKQWLVDIFGSDRAKGIIADLETLKSADKTAEALGLIFTEVTQRKAFSAAQYKNADPLERAQQLARQNKQRITALKSVMERETVERIGDLLEMAGSYGLMRQDVLAYIESDGLEAVEYALFSLVGELKAKGHIIDPLFGAVKTPGIENLADVIRANKAQSSKTDTFWS